MRGPRIAQVRAYTVAAKGGADYHDQEGYHWIDDHISTPMAKYPGFADSRRSFGINVLGTLVVNNSVYLPGRRTIGWVCTDGCSPSILRLRNNAIKVGGVSGEEDGEGAEDGERTHARTLVSAGDPRPRPGRGTGT